jgi:hypothetical protein
MISPGLINKQQFRLLLMIALLYVGIGIIPAGAIDRFGLDGAWKLLGYPRLYLLLALFLIIVGTIETARSAGLSQTRSV